MFKAIPFIFLFLSFLAMSQSKTPMTQQEITNAMQQLLKASDSVYVNKGDIKIEHDLLVKADSLSNYLKTINDTLPLTIKKNLASIYMDTDKNDKAIYYYTQALELAKKQNLRDEIIQALMFIGQGHAKKLEFDDAIPFLEKSLKLLDEKDSEKYSDMKTNVLINLGIIHLDNQKTEAAIELFNKALVLAILDEDFENQMVIYSNLSICYSDLSQFKLAIKQLKKAIQVNDLNNLGQFSELYDNLGANYADLKQYDSAQYYFKKCHEIALANNDKNAICGILTSIGWMYCKQKKYEESIPYLKIGYKIADSLQNIEVAMESSINLSEAYEQTKDHSNALMYFKKYFQQKKTLHTHTTENKFEEFNTKYETLEKEEKIASLNKENELNQIIITQKKRQKKTLAIVFSLSLLLLILGVWVWFRMHKKRLLEKQYSLRFKSVIKTEQKERKRIAQELYNSIGQSISILKNQVEILKPKTDSEKIIHSKLLHQVDQVYDDLQNVSHNIMPNTLITLGIMPALKELITDMNADGSLEIELKNQADLNSLNEIQTINLFRIIQESLVNVIKHAKASLVTINFLNEKGMTRVKIKDNGIGMSSSAIKNLKGIGWKNIISRVAVLSGDIDVVSQPNQGTSITVSINT